MQTILQKGKNYLEIDIAYLSDFVEGIKYKLDFSQDNCRKEFADADTELCGSIVILSFDLVRCLEKDGKWLVEIKNISTKAVIHKIFVQVYKIN